MSIPSSKRMKMDDSGKGIQAMRVAELRKEIKKRDKKQKITGVRRQELRSILFSMIRLSPQEIDQSTKNQLVNSMNMFGGHHAKSKFTRWKVDDLKAYAKFVHADESSTDKTHGELYSEYQTSLRRETVQKEEMEREQRVLSEIKVTFFDQKDGKLIPKPSSETMDKVVVQYLRTSDRICVHQFAEKHGLLSESSGSTSVSNRFIAVGRDQIQMNNAVRPYLDKLYREVREQNDTKWEGMKEKNKKLRERGNARGIYGEWVMNENFGYGNKDRYYLYFNQRDGGIFGSFLIGPIEGKLRLLSHNLKRKCKFEWRGQETGEGEIQIGDGKAGEIKFGDKGTTLKGVLRSDYGDFEFDAIKISDEIKKRATRYDFEYDEEEAHEEARCNRWG